jgi:hypothetical protein
MAGVDVITPPRAVERPSIGPVVGGTLVGTLLVVGGISLAYLAFATPFLARLVPSGRLDATQTVVGIAIWSAALVAPAGFVLVGTSRLARILGAARRRMPRRSPYHTAIGALPEGVILARGLTLPDGRGISDLLVGPFGAAIIRELPPQAITRVRNGNWELRTARSWVPLENPLDRATRDAERVRRWLAHDDTDFVVKTYAAVVAAGHTVARTTTCAVLTPDEVAPWIAALPAQRSQTTGRRERILDIVRRAAI